MLTLCHGIPVVKSKARPAMWTGSAGSGVNKVSTYVIIIRPFTANKAKSDSFLTLDCSISPFMAYVIPHLLIPNIHPLSLREFTPCQSLGPPTRRKHPCLSPVRRFHRGRTSIDFPGIIHQHRFYDRFSDMSAAAAEEGIA